jgi:type IV secretion system protein VirB6
MAESFDFYSTAYNKISGTLNTYVSDTASNVISGITPVATELFVLYIVIYGISMMRGLVDEPITDFAMRTVRIGFIMGIGLTLGTYNGHIVSFLWNSPDALANLVVGNTSGNSNIEFLDTLVTSFYELGQKYWAFSSGWTSPDFGPKFTAILIWAVGVAVTLYGAFLLILSKMALAVILGIGPIFILLLMFESTKKFFESWLGQAMNYVFMLALTAAVIKMVLNIVQDYLGSANVLAQGGSISAAIPPLALGLVGCLVMMQLSGVASALGGGVAISTLGAANAVWNKAKNAAGGAKNLASGKTLSDMRGARRTKETNARWAARNPGVTATAAGMTMKAFKKATATPNRVKSA